MTERDAHLMLQLIQFAYEAVRFLAFGVMSALRFLYDLTPGTWPDPWRFGAISAVLALAYGVFLVLRK